MATQIRTQTQTQTENDSIERLLEDISSTNTKPLWAQMTKLNPPLPNPKSIPFVWNYDVVRPNLMRAGKLVTEEQAERRVLMLINPEMGELRGLEVPQSKN